MFVLDARSTRGAPGEPRPTLHHRARSRRGRHGHRVCRARPEARPSRRAQGAETRARGAARHRAVPERDPGHRTPAAPTHPAAVRLRPSRGPRLLRDAAPGRRIAAPAAGTREAAAAGDGDRDHSRGRERPRLRPPPRRDPPRHQAREHPVPGRTGGRRRFRDRARPERGRGLAPDGDGAVPRHAAVYEPRAGDRRPHARCAERHLLARLRPLRDARGRAAPHRPHRPVRDRQGPDGPSSPPPGAPRRGAAAARSRRPEGAREGAADRYGSAAQFAEALTHAPATATLEVPTAGEHGPRARGVAIVPWALAVLATGAAAWAWLRPAPRPPAVPVVRFSLSFENGFQPTDFRGSPIALAPDGSRIVYAGTDSLGTRWLFSRGFARVEPALIPGTAGAGRPVSPPARQSIGVWRHVRPAL